MLGMRSGQASRQLSLLTPGRGLLTRSRPAHPRPRPAPSLQKTEQCAFVKPLLAPCDVEMEALHRVTMPSTRFGAKASLTVSMWHLAACLKACSKKTT